MDEWLAMVVVWGRGHCTLRIECASLGVKRDTPCNAL